MPFIFLTMSVLNNQQGWKRGKLLERERERATNNIKCDKKGGQKSVT